MKGVTAKGTAKVGRWTYPAEQDEHGTIRNTKRDGSGEWVKVDAAAFTPDQVVVDSLTATADAMLKEAVSKAKGESADYRALRAVHLAIFNSGIWANKDDLQVEVDGANLTEKRGLELARYLRDAKLVVEERSAKYDGFKTGEPMFSSSPNWDEASEAMSLDLFEQTIPRDVVVKSRKIASGPVTNNTHKKPGRSTWKVGDPCPQGHILEDGDVYVMPSGRVQCRQCRAGYPSNI